MASYVSSYHVPSGYPPNAGCPPNGRSWSGLGWVDIGHTVTDDVWPGEVGGSGSPMIGHSVVSAEDLDSALGAGQGPPGAAGRQRGRPRGGNRRTVSVALTASTASRLER